MTLQKAKPKTSKYSEEILVVPREELFSTCPAWHGIKGDNVDHYVELIQEQKEFLPRYAMEEDTNYKQIIPYLIFKHNDAYFLMQRADKSSEQRLKSKYTLGIGGHIRKEDVFGKDIFEWAKREFNEEVNYNGSFSITTLGILNDDSNAVGKVHLGLVLLLNGDSSHISIKSELQKGSLVLLSECKKYYQQMETWSQLTLSFLS